MNPPQIHLASLLTGTLLLTSLSARPANLVPNGDFSGGNTGFTSDYTYVNGSSSSLIPEATYYVGTSPSLYHPSFANYGDHTSGKGNMMIVNGAPDTSFDVWRTASDITVSPNTLYYFEAWMSSAYPASPGALTFGLEGDASNATLGVGTAPTTTGTWVPLSFTWNSGANTSVSLYLKNANPVRGGNDFAVDDIFLGLQTSIHTPDEGSTLALMGSALAVGLGVRRHLRPPIV